MHNYSYKKNKLEQLRGFCAVVECGTIVEAAKKLHLSESSISLQISSLEQDLKVKLFDKVGRNLKINTYGKAYYLKAKEVLNKVEDIYNEELILKISKVEIWKMKIKRCVKKYNNILFNSFEKNVIKIKWKSFLLLLMIIIFSILLYLYHTNWFFDRKIIKLANPLLKEIMATGYYTVDKNEKCSLLGADFNEGVLNLLFRFNNISCSTVILNECPSQAIRMNGIDAVDKKFNNKNFITCKTEEIFDRIRRLSKLTIDTLEENKNFKIYSIYKRTDCVNHDVFEQNVEKYKNRIFAKKDLEVDNFKHIGRIWFIKYKKYYYIFAEKNGRQGHYESKIEDHLFVFEKLTLSELINYKGGAYWRIIKEYNINID